MSLTRHLVCIALTISTSSLCAAESPSPATLSSSDDATIRELETKSWVAWKGHDATFFQQFLSEDHVEIHSYGIVGKAAVVEGVRSPACVVQTYTLGPFSLTAVTQDSVLVTYRAEQNTSCGEQKVPSPVWATSLYAKRAGRWVNVMYQHTPTARG
jgi:Domain of unknown function (DUF4440)